LPLFDYRNRVFGSIDKSQRLFLLICDIFNKGKQGAGILPAPAASGFAEWMKMALP
jgi:hypothetical protein